VDRAQAAGYRFWTEGLYILYKASWSEEYITRRAAERLHVLDDDSGKAGMLVAVLEAGLYSGCTSIICGILLKLQRSPERELREVFRLAKDEALADMLSSFTLYLSEKPTLTKGDIEAHLNVSVCLGTLIDMNRMPRIFDMSLRRLHSSCRPLCLWVFLEMLMDRDCNVVEELLSRLNCLILGEGAAFDESRQLMAALITSGVLVQIQIYTKVREADSSINPYFYRLYSTMRLFLEPEFNRVLKSMSSSSDRKEQRFFERIEYHAHIVNTEDALVEKAKEESYRFLEPIHYGS